MRIFLILEDKILENVSEYLSNLCISISKMVVTTQTSFYYNPPILGKILIQNNLVGKTKF
ncbi:hypothetical protein JP09_004100 [Dehalogenimonas etheniformans]|uniref:Uncharacterized protein n=1 Tax=Dehalogenimonas etheniformans TaxID=1536648 RepID=A0A2P5P813_9CHLR|nr:hypothetical protein JP09_004100 [Dehalogenimonas etheniformans]